jgi:hypothetical protein
MIPVGAFLFIHNFDGEEEYVGYHDGLGNASHIGIYTAMSGAEMVALAIAEGDSIADRYNFGNGAFHSSSSRGAVATSNFSGKSISGGWNRIGLYDQFDYGLNDGQDEDGKDEKPMQGTVTAQTGATVNLRKSPGGDLIERVPVGTKVTIIDYGPEWCEVTTGKLTGWMMTEFIEIDGEIVPGQDDDAAPGGEGTVLLDVPLEAAAAAYPFLRDICEQIEKKVGRG